MVDLVEVCYRPLGKTLKRFVRMTMMHLWQEGMQVRGVPEATVQQQWLLARLEALKGVVVVASAAVVLAGLSSR